MRIKASKLLAAVLALCLTLGTAPAASAAASARQSPPRFAREMHAATAERKKRKIMEHPTVFWIRFYKYCVIFLQSLNLNYSID